MVPPKTNNMVLMICNMSESCAGAATARTFARATVMSSGVIHAGTSMGTNGSTAGPGR